MRTLILAFFLVLAPFAPSLAQTPNIERHTVHLPLDVDAQGRGTLPDYDGVPDLLMDRFRCLIETWRFEPARSKGKQVPGSTGIYFVLELTLRDDGDQQVRLLNAAIAPVVQIRTLPRYPLEAARDSRGGDVLLELTISRYGRVRDVDVIETNAKADIVKAAVDAAYATGFIPNRVDGKSVETKVHLPFAFRPNVAEKKDSAAERTATPLVQSPDQIRLLTEVTPQHLSCAAADRARPPT